MRKRIFTLLAALCLLLCLLPTAAFASQTGSKTDESRSYNFDLSAGGASEVRATTGETITVTSLPMNQKKGKKYVYRKTD